MTGQQTSHRYLAVVDHAGRVRDERVVPVDTQTRDLVVARRGIGEGVGGIGEIRARPTHRARAPRWGV